MIRRARSWGNQEEVEADAVGQAEAVQGRMKARVVAA
jgi:hypothetical protein